MKSSASVFPFSQHHFYSVNLSNHPKRVYYEDDETNKGGKQDFFIIILEGETSLFQVFNWKDGHFVSMESFIIIPFICEYFCVLFQCGQGEGCCFGAVPCEAGLQPHFLARSPLAWSVCKEEKQETYPSALRPIFNPF